MGLSSSLYTGISGLQTNSQAMGVTGNNISNVNTTAFKSSDTVFSDVLSTSIASADGNSQVGQGSQVSAVEKNFSQGAFESTSSGLDLAIDGDGFFIVSNPENNIMLYTRNGSFSFDEQGYLVTADGLRVQGTQYNDDGALENGIVSDIQLDMLSQIEAELTGNVTLNTNLDSNSELLGAFDVADAANTSNFSTTSIVYDSLGTSHTATCFFTKTADQTWEYNVAVDSDELAAGGAEDLTIVSTGVITFDQNGNLLTGEEGDTAALEWNNGSDPNQVITYNFDITQFDSDSAIYSQSQDGYTAGEINSVDIAADGTVSAVYSNGQTVAVSMLSLATFVSPNGLNSVGNSLYSETASSGTPTIGTPGESMGSLVSQALELSNVDLSAEFVDLITIQNGYNANSKLITTVDEMLQEVLNMKR